MVLQIITFIFLLAFVLGNITKVPIPTTNHFISFLDVAVLIIYIFRFLTSWFEIHTNLKNYSSIAKSLAVFICLALLSLIVSGREFGASALATGSLYICRLILYSGLIFILPKKISYFWIGLSVAIIGMLQYLFIPDMRFMTAQNWDPHYFRLVGSFLDPGFTGLLIVFWLGWLITFPGKNQKFWLIFGYICLALTYSRSSYLAYLVLMGIITVKKQSPILFIKVIIIGVITILILPHPGGEGVRLERTSTIQARIINWQNTLTISSKNPWIGVGFNVYRYAQYKYQLLPEEEWQKNHAGAGADSSLLFILATTGMAGFCAYVWYIKNLLRVSNLYVFLIPTIIHATFLNSLLYPAVLCSLAIITIRLMEHK